jgi:hypothetical protein
MWMLSSALTNNNNNNNKQLINNKHSIDSLQKTAILGTSHIIRKVLQSETRSLSGTITAVSREVPGRKGL